VGREFSRLEPAAKRVSICSTSGSIMRRRRVEAC
jgi:hypothetical protein